jgi:hypothetical protein
MNGQLSPATIDEDGEGDPRRPSEVRELVEGRAHGAPGIEHVVDDDDLRPIDIPRELGLPDHRSRTDGLEIVSIERDIERPARRRIAFALADELGQSVRQLNAASLYTDQHQAIRPAVELNDLARHPLQRAVYCPGVQQYE